MNQKIAFRHISVGSLFASNEFPLSRLKKISDERAVYVGGEDCPPDIVGHTISPGPEHRFQPINHV